MAEELNEALLEGIHVDKWTPGAWANTVGEDEEWQPEMEPPHINDYSAFKKHKHYGQYFKPYRYRPFPAWMYHKSEEPRIVKTKEEVVALGPEWAPTPNKPRTDMTGKSLPVKSETQKLAETVAAALAAKTTGSGAVDPSMIAAIVAGVMAAMPQNQAQIVRPTEQDLAKTDVDGLRSFLEHPKAPEDRTVSDDHVERTALIELAEKDGVKIDKRWSNERLKKELGLD